MVCIKSLPDDAKLSEILNNLFGIVEGTATENSPCVEWITEDDVIQPQLFRALLRSYTQVSPIKIDSSLTTQESGIITFDGFDEIQSSKVKELETWLRKQPEYNPRLNTAITYLLDELVCNIQQHSCCHQCLVCASVNTSNRSIDFCISDNGISLYGSYVKSGRYRENLGKDSISALCMAKDGFSTKNRPDAENRGYGISSNIKMTIDGLAGDFTIISGNALYVNTAGKQQIIGLPDTIEWQGTTIVVRIPIDSPTDFNLYNYIA